MGGPESRDDGCTGRVGCVCVPEMGSAHGDFNFFEQYFVQDSLAIRSAAADVWEGREGQRMKSALRSYHHEHHQLSAQSRVKWEVDRSDRRERMALSSRSIYLSETLSDMLSSITSALDLPWSSRYQLLIGRFPIDAASTRRSHRLLTSVQPLLPVAHCRIHIGAASTHPSSHRLLTLVQPLLPVPLVGVPSVPPALVPVVMALSEPNARGPRTSTSLSIPS